MSFDLFENIDFKNLNKVIDIVKNETDHIDNLKISYSKNNSFVQETLNFLISLEIIKIHNNTVELLINDKEDFKKDLFLKIFNNTEYALYLKDYLSNFQKKNNTYQFKPNSLYNNLTFDLRNFLISSNKIEFENNFYRIVDEKILEFSLKKEFSPEDLKKVLLKQEQIGLDAEKIVLKKETEKVALIDNRLSVDHVSLRDVSAGYDIKSFIKENNEVYEIYIEVKAVSKSNYKFHLSIQESQTASKFKDRYFVYLLPVDFSKPEKFDYEKILIINSIDKNIIKNKFQWKVENDGFVISKNN